MRNSVPGHPAPGLLRGRHWLGIKSPNERPLLRARQRPPGEPGHGESRFVGFKALICRGLSYVRLRLLAERGVEPLLHRLDRTRGGQRLVGWDLESFRGLDGRIPSIRRARPAAPAWAGPRLLIGKPLALPCLLQIDGLVAAVLVELGAPHFVRALVFGWAEADGRPETHVEIT
jgi:hypothetical protein